MLLCGICALIAWPQARSNEVGQTSTLSWVARLAIAGSVLFALAIGLCSLATALVPSCAR
jgi:hypothetical protein